MGGATNNGPGSKSTVKIFANIFISFIGAGVLGLPYAFMEAGILEGVLIMSFVALVSAKAMLLLIDCKYRLIQKSSGRPYTNGGTSNGKANGKIKATAEEKESLVEISMQAITEIPATIIAEPVIPMAPGQELTYGDVGYYAMGTSGQLLVDVIIIVSQIGFCCAYLIFISENLSDYITGLKLIHWLCVMLPPLTLLTFIRHLSTLAISSLFAQISNLFAFAVVFWFDLEHFSHITRIHPKEMSLEGFPFFLAVAMYCYEGAGMILSLEASLAQEKRHRFKHYFKITMIVVTSLYISFGVCGYLSFGDETNQIITLNLPVGFGFDFAMVVKSCLCLALFFTYPVMMFPVIQLLETKWFPSAQESTLKGNILRVVLVAVTGLTVLAIPNFANIIGLIGATCCTFLAFIMPGLFHLKIFSGSLSKSDYAVDIFLIALGIVGGIVGTLDALQRLQETHSSDPDVVFVSVNETVSSAKDLLSSALTSAGNTTAAAAAELISTTLTNATNSLTNATNSSSLL